MFLLFKIGSICFLLLPIKLDTLSLSNYFKFYSFWFCCKIRSISFFSFPSFSRFDQYSYILFGLVARFDQCLFPFLLLHDFIKILTVFLWSVNSIPPGNIFPSPDFIFSFLWYAIHISTLKIYNIHTFFSFFNGSTLTWDLTEDLRCLKIGG